MFAMRAFLLSLAALALPGPARAQAFEGAALLAFGGAQRALGTGNDTIYANPAGMALSNVYSLEGNFELRPGGGDRRLNASILDSQSGPIAGGVAYTHLAQSLGQGQNGELTLGGHRLDFGLGARFSDTGALGVAVRYLDIRREDDGQRIDAQSYRRFTIDAGLQWQGESGLSLGIVGSNLSNPSQDALAVAIGGGLGYRVEMFSIEGDIRYSRVDLLLSGAIGYAVAGVLPLRFGILSDQTHSLTWLSGGLGYRDNQFGLDVGYRQQIGEVAGPRERIFATSLRLVFL